MRQNPTTIGQESLKQKIHRRLTGENPSSVKVQVMTAAGFALASYVLFFVLTNGSVDASGDTGNIIAEGQETTIPATAASKPSSSKEPPGLPGSGIDVITRVAQGASQQHRRAQLVKLTEAEYESFFGNLEHASRGIERHVQSRSGTKAMCEMRYRAFEAVVTTILKRDSAVFARDRSLASKWQDVKNATADIYRISYHPFGYSAARLAGRHDWYSSLTKRIFRDGEPPTVIPYLEHNQSIASARERLFDQRLTVAEYETGLAAHAFVKQVVEATKNAHTAMDAFYDVLISIAPSNRVVKSAIGNRHEFEDDLVSVLRDDYDLRAFFQRAGGQGLQYEGMLDFGFVNVLSYPPYVCSTQFEDEDDREKMRRRGGKAWSLKSEMNRQIPRSRRRPRNP